MNKYKGKSNIDIVKSYLSGERPFVQVGYVPEKIVRKVGDEWVDIKGTRWIQKECGPVTINKQADEIRKFIDQTCKCGQNIKFGNKRDQLFFNKTGLCENCLIDYETKLRILGIYNDYEKYKLISNELGYLKDIREKLKDAIKYCEENSGDMTSVCNSEGFLERWKDTNQPQILKMRRKILNL